MVGFHNKPSSSPKNKNMLSARAPHIFYCHSLKCNLFSTSSMRKFSGRILLPLMLCTLMLGQIMTAGHEHEMDAPLNSECAICAHAAQNDDLDVPKPLDAKAAAFLTLRHSETATRPTIKLARKAKARAPPYS